MLLPRFKLRTALICLTAAAFISLLIREGARGTEWAIGATIGMASLLLWLLLMAIFYGVALVFRPISVSSGSGKAKDSVYGLSDKTSIEKSSHERGPSEESVSAEASVKQPLANQGGDWLEGDRDG